MSYRALLTLEEREREQQFYYEKHRHQYLVARALVRTALSRYTGIAPGDLRFFKNDYGRPEMMLEGGSAPLRFSLSHTGGLIAFAVMLEEDIGVDVEDMERREVSLECADRFFSKKEVSDLHRVEEKRKRERFYDYWTLKESFIKARGMGLSIPLDQFSFHISDHEPLRISFDPRWAEAPNRWRFWLSEPNLIVAL